MSGVLANMGLTFSSTKLKVNLKMATTRMQLAINKKTNAIKIAKKDIAGLLAEGKEEKARIRVEPIIRDDFTIEAYEILSLITELLTERMRIIESQKECPPDLVEALSTLVYASDRIDVQELIEVKKQIKLKYGKAFVQRAEVNEGGICNERIVHKLSLQPPSQFLCVSYLQEIANKYEVDWTPPEDMPMDAAGVAANSFGYSVPNAPGTEFAHIEETKPEANNFASPPPVAAPAPAPAPINDNNSATGLGKFVPNLKRKGAGGGGGGAPAAPTEPSGKPPTNPPAPFVAPDEEFEGTNVDLSSQIPLQPTPAPVIPPAESIPVGDDQVDVPMGEADLSSQIPLAPESAQLPTSDEAGEDQDLAARIAALKQTDTTSKVSSEADFNQTLEARIKILRADEDRQPSAGDLAERLAAIRGETLGQPPPQQGELESRFQAIKGDLGPTPIDSEYEAEVVAANAIAEASSLDQTGLPSSSAQGLSLDEDLQQVTLDALSSVEAHLALVQKEKASADTNLNPNTQNPSEIMEAEDLLSAAADEVTLDQKHGLPTFESDRNEAIKNGDALAEQLASMDRQEISKKDDGTDFDLSAFVTKLAQGVQVTKYNARGKAQSRTLTLVGGGRYLCWQPKKKDKRADISELESIHFMKNDIETGKDINMTVAERHSTLTLKFECGRVLNVVCASAAEKEELATGLQRLSEFADEDLEYLIPEGDS